MSELKLIFVTDKRTKSWHEMGPGQNSVNYMRQKEMNDINVIRFGRVEFKEKIDTKDGENWRTLWRIAQALGIEGPKKIR